MIFYDFEMIRHLKNRISDFMVSFFVSVSLKLAIYGHLIKPNDIQPLNHVFHLFMTYYARTNRWYMSRKACCQVLLHPNDKITFLPCLATWPVINIRFPMTVRSLHRLTWCFVFGERLLFSDCWPIKQRMLYAKIVSSNTNSFVSNLPEGSRSTSMSDLISLWNCSHSPWAW